MMTSGPLTLVTYSQQTSAISSSMLATSTITSTETLQMKSTTSESSDESIEQSFKNTETSTETSPYAFTEVTTTEKTRSMLPTEPSSLSRPQDTDDLPLLHIEGSIQTVQIYHEDFKSKNNLRYLNFKSNFELEMGRMLKSNCQIETAKVSVIDIKNADADLRRSNSANAAVIFVSICSFVRDQSKNLKETIKEIESSIIISLKNVDPNIYIILANATFTISVREPRIIEIESSSKADISEKIGTIIVCEYLNLTFIKSIVQHAVFIIYC